MVSAASPPPRRRWHRQFLALLPQIVTRAKIAFRELEARSQGRNGSGGRGQRLTGIRPSGPTRKDRHRLRCAAGGLRLQTTGLVIVTAPNRGKQRRPIRGWAAKLQAFARNNTISS